MANNKSNPSYKKDSSTLNAAQLFGFCILTGGISIIVGTVFGTSSWIPAWFAMMINFGLPVCVILFYTYSVNKDTSDTLSIEQKADSVYYMGFILTLFAMTASLIALAASGDDLEFNAVVINFGLALTTTILGLSIRIMWLQLSSQSLADAESILRQKIMRRSQDLQDQTEKVVGSLTALSNQLATVSEPLKQSFNSLGNLDTSAESASQSLIQIAGLADRLETSVSLLQENVDSDMVKNVEDLAKSINTVNPKISNSANAIQNSLDKLQKDIEKTDEMIADTQTNLEKNNSLLKRITSNISSIFNSYDGGQKFNDMNKRKASINNKIDKVISGSDRASQFKDK
tara:strand:+ start:96 stop:1127 length:1032 start_codon:yes stop_codon:yes gene_type:complete